MTQTMQALDKNITVKAAKLTRTEDAVLSFLESKLGRVVTRNEIQAAVWPGQEDINPSSVDKHLSSIRAKLGGKVSIQTFYGAGYILIRKTWNRA